MTGFQNVPWFFNLTQWAAWVLNLSEIHSKLHTIVPRALGLEKGNVAEVLQVEVGEETQEKKAEDSFFFFLHSSASTVSWELCCPLEKILLHLFLQLKRDRDFIL